ncbi:flagellin [Domibacillus aminovorans]|uniref:Flagellin n=1 Tax=Domibacillus aminovorans TaxID=29332 RepID=A0A177KMI0_9BACI|nr:flagellin [Domibacillus aminovorans]OAH54610.1 flagellin [Domibacillus aminovorans]
MRIQHNTIAINAHRMYNSALKQQATAMERLSSGLRINRAADDSAGLAISEKMRAQIRGLNQASRNAQDAISMIQTGEGALNETHAILQKMRELSVQAASDTNTDTDRQAIQKEINQLTEEITRIGSTTQFNTMNLLDGSKPSFTIQVGANAGQTMTIEMADMRAHALGITSARGPVNVTTTSSASAAITIFDDAIKKVSSQRSQFGAYSNRLEHTINNLNTADENLTAAESRIRDADMAKETMNQVKASILAEVSMAMMVQANQAPQSVLQLLR